MKNFPPNVSPRTFTSSAIIVAYLLMGDISITEQDAVGEWLMLVGQVLSTDATQRSVLEERKALEQEKNEEDQIDIIKNALDKMQKQIDKLKKDSC